MLIYHILSVSILSSVQKERERKNKANRSLLVNVTLNNASKTKNAESEAQNLFLPWACLAMASSFLFRAAFSFFSLSSSASAS
jgi:hypothetical protein